VGGNYRNNPTENDEKSRNLIEKKVKLWQASFVGIELETSTTNYNNFFLFKTLCQLGKSAPLSPSDDSLTLW